MALGEKETETWGIGGVIQQRLSGSATTHERFVDTANAHASVWSREQAAIASMKSY